MPPTADPRDPDGAKDDEPGLARGANTLTEAIDELASQGYVHSFQVAPRGDGGPPRVRCLHCRNDSAPESMHIEGAMRLEGASDPDEMVIVIATVCPVCGVRGTLTLGYGPMASPEDDDVLTALPVEPHHLGFS